MYLNIYTHQCLQVTFPLFVNGKIKKILHMKNLKKFQLIFRLIDQWFFSSKLFSFNLIFISFIFIDIIFVYNSFNVKILYLTCIKCYVSTYVCCRMCLFTHWHSWQDTETFKTKIKIQDLKCKPEYNKQIEKYVKVLTFYLSSNWVKSTMEQFSLHFPWCIRVHNWSI